MSFGGVLLTGGASRRLGVDKATLRVDGETLAAVAARKLGAVCAAVVEVGAGVTELRATREDPAGSGPLAALVAGVDALAMPEGAPVLLFACDLPDVPVGLLRLLAEWPGSGTVIPVARGELQYTCARYGPEAIAAARELVAQGRRALRELARLEHETVSEEIWGRVAAPDAFLDVDTGEDLARLGSRLS